MTVPFRTSGATARVQSIAAQMCRMRELPVLEGPRERSCVSHGALPIGSTAELPGQALAQDP